MKIDITYRNVNKESHQSTRQAIEEHVERHLTPKLTAFDVGQLDMHATVELAKPGHYKVIYRLHLPPRKILVAKDKDDKLLTAIQKVTTELTRQAKRHRAQVNGRQNWKRKGRDKRLEDIYMGVDQTMQAPVKQRVQEQVSPLQPRIEEFIRHELTYLRSNGDLLPDYPRMADIRDEAVARLHVDWSQLDGSDEALYRKLLREVTYVLTQEVEQTRINAEQLNIDATIMPDAMDQAESMVEEENGEFYQPDEVLHIQDLIPDTHVEDPEVTADGYHDHFYSILAGLPIQWRRSALLVHKEGLSVQEVADHVLHKSDAEVSKMLHLADSYMYERLKEAGFEPPLENTIGEFLRF